jgi:tetratricopeptide (TPR) repeat protein
LRRARSLHDEGKLKEALDLLRPLAQDPEHNLELGFWLQDLEWERAEGVEGETAALVERYSRRAESDPTPARLILAARLVGGGQALDLLGEAIELDPDHPWAHYALAQVLLSERQRANRWRDARAALARALELDPSHLRARHLEAWILAQEGEAAQASSALEHWLEQTRGDPRVPLALRLEAEVDLALMWIRLGHAVQAEALLSTQDGQGAGRPRRLLALAVAQHEQDDFDEALNTARRAELADPRALLPMVQQALMFEQRGREEDAKLARNRWQQVWDAAADQGGFSGLLQSVRARVHLERSEQEAESVDIDPDDGAGN